MWKFRIVLSLVFLHCFVFSEVQLKVALNSGEVFNNCKFENFLGDTLYISLLTEDNSEITILAENIKSIVVLDGPSIKKFDFEIISLPNKVSALNQIFTTTNSISTTPVMPISSTYTDAQFRLVIIFVSIFFLIVIIISVLLKKREKPGDEENIPGAKEMVETMMMWAKRNREKRSKD